jgi:hypothetical protein
MRFTAALTVAAMAGVSAAHGSIEHPKNGTAPAYVTEVVTAYTTYCPEPTEITHAGETYTVSEATTLTITNCPGGKNCTLAWICHKPFSNTHPGCTVVKPATSSVVSVCHDCSSTSAVVVPETTETPAAPVETLVEPTHETPAVPAAPYPSANGTVPIEAPAPSGTGAPTESATAPPFEGAAAALSATGAGLLAIFGLIAAL